MTNLEHFQVTHPDLEVIVKVDRVLPGVFRAVLQNDGGQICTAVGSSHETALEQLAFQAERAFALEVNTW